MEQRRFRPINRLMALVGFLAVVTGGVAWADAPGPLPLLWQGRVVDAEGAPTAARVHAFIRPPASAIPLAGEGEAPASIPLASATTARDGHFQLRAEKPVVPAAYTPDGWVHIMVLTEAGDGSWAIATDSVRYVHPGGGLRQGAWLSSVAAADHLERLRAAHADPRTMQRAVQTLTARELGGDLEHPSVIRLDGVPTAQKTHGWTPPGDPYTGCTARYVEERKVGMRTIADIDVGPNWSYRIEYQETDTTSWDVGYEYSGGKWKVAGTASFSDHDSGGFNSRFGPYHHRFREAYQVRLVHAKVLWRCGSRTSPGPFYVRTVEPENWTGGTWNQGDPVVRCKRGNEEPVAGNTYGWRGKGKASKFSASGAVLGFSGRAAVTYTSAIKLGWMNHLEHPRYVCGESGNPYKGRTRVVALD